MTLAISGTAPEARAEQLLRSLEGVLAARVVTDRTGRFTEIHVIAPHDIHPKQVVRNVESALSAGLGIEIDRRIVSVARADGELPLNGVHAPEADAPPSPDEASAEPTAGTSARTPTGRLVFTGFDAHRDATRRIACTVALEHAGDRVAGDGEGPDTPKGRAEAGARAAFAALGQVCRNTVALEGVSLVRAHGRTYVHIAAHGLAGREAVALTGTAALDRSAEEAGVLAALQATNRWVRVPA